MMGLVALGFGWLMGLRVSLAWSKPVVKTAECVNVSCWYNIQGVREYIIHSTTRARPIFFPRLAPGHGRLCRATRKPKRLFIYVSPAKAARKTQASLQQQALVK